MDHLEAAGARGSGNDVVIVSAVRTPVGQIRGALAEVRPDDLAAIAVREALGRAGVDGSLVEEVILGCANGAGEDNRNVARMSALLAGLPDEVAGVTVNRLCASGLHAVNAAARAIRCGEGDVFVAGGVESMSRAPYALPKGSAPFASGNLTAYDTSLGWRFPNPRLAERIPLEAMGETAENIVERSRAGELHGGEITRQEQDLFALRSQERAVRALNEGRFRNEIVSVEIPRRRGDPVVVDTDEHPRYRRDGERFELATSMEALAALRPAFREGGTVTAGNSSGLNDGAAALVLMSRARADALGVRPLARWLGSAAAGVDPRVMGLGPVPAVRKVLARTGVPLEEVDVVELNEAFAAQALAVQRELGIPDERLNPNGGAIALGHPLGASGARLVTTLVHELARRHEQGERGRYGLVTLCVGVGQGEAALFERL